MKRVAALILALVVVSSCNRDPNVAKKRYLEMGDNYYKRGQYKQALLLYKNALRRDAKYGMAYYKLALTDIRLGSAVPAVGELRRAIELLPANSPEREDSEIKLADIYVAFNAREKQFLDEVDATIARLLKKDPNSFDGHRLKAARSFADARQEFGQGHIDRGKALLETSIDEFRKADHAKPGQTPIRLALAAALIFDRQFPESEAIYQDLIGKDKTLGQGYINLYRLYVTENRLADAETILKRAAANNPKETGYLTMLAQYYYQTKRHDEMVKVLEQIKSHAKENQNAYMLVGDFYFRLGDGDEAIRQYKEGQQADPKRKAAYQKHIIEVLMHEGKRGLAAEINDEILKDNPRDSDARGLQATLMLDKGEVTKAIAQLQSVITSAPENFVAHFNLGRAHVARQEWEQARQQFAEVIRLRPDYVPARVELAKLEAAHGDYEAALKSAAEILQWDRGNIAARLIQSASLLGMKKYDQSRALLQAMLKADPGSTDTLFQLGVVYLAEGNYKEAEDTFRKDYSLEPANSRGLMGMVEVYMAQNQEDQAIKLLQDETTKSPNRMDYHLALGNTAVRVGKYDLAIAEFRKVLDVADKNSKSAGDLYLRLGETYRRKGDLNNAIGALQKARTLMPENTVIISTLALSLDSAGRKQEAKSAYEQCLKVDPRNGVALNNLAYLLAENNGDLDQALTYAQRAKQMLPQLYEISDTLGWIYLKKQLTDQAIDQFREIVAKQPQHSTYRYHLGMGYAQKGDRIKAAQELNLALKSNPAREEADKIKQLLAKLQ